MILAACFSLAHATHAAPKVTVDEAHHDFGRVSSQQPVEHTFVIKNEGTEPLEILKSRSSCGCTVAAISQRTLAPGETSEITGRFNPAGRRGNQRNVITLDTNDPETPRVQLVMSGIIEELVRVEPNGLFMGAIGMTNAIDQAVDVYSEAHPLTITSLDVQPPLVEARVEVVEENKHHLVHITAPGPFPAGDLRAHVILKTSSSAYPQIVIPVFAQVAGALITAPKEIAVPAATPTPVTRYVMVRPGTAKEFNVLEVIPPDDQMDIQLLALPNHQGYRIRINNITPDVADQGALRIRTDRNEMTWIDVPFRVIQ